MLQNGRAKVFDPKILTCTRGCTLRPTTPAVNLLEIVNEGTQFPLHFKTKPRGGGGGGPQGFHRQLFHLVGRDHRDFPGEAGCRHQALNDAVGRLIRRGIADDNIGGAARRPGSLLGPHAAIEHEGDTPWRGIVQLLQKVGERLAGGCTVAFMQGPKIGPRENHAVPINKKVARTHTGKASRGLKKTRPWLWAPSWLSPSGV